MTYIRHDPQTGDDIILSPTKKSWAEIFAALDEAGMPDDFLVDRDQSPPQERPDL